MLKHDFACCRRRNRGDKTNRFLHATAAAGLMHYAPRE